MYVYETSNTCHTQIGTDSIEISLIKFLKYRGCGFWSIVAYENFGKEGKSEVFLSSSTLKFNFSKIV